MTFLKSPSFHCRIEDFANGMYKNKKNVMEFIENVKNELSILKDIIKFNNLLPTHSLR